MASRNPIRSGEIWYPIPSLFDHELSSDLRVRRWYSTSNGKPCEPWVPCGIARLVAVTPRGKGYPGFTVDVPPVPPRLKSTATYLLHRVVMEVALGRALQPGEMVLHHDDDKANCHISNLKLGDAMMNAADAVRNGRIRNASSSGVVLNMAQATEIRRLFEGGWSEWELARHFDVQHATILRVLRRKTFRIIT